MGYYSEENVRQAVNWGTNDNFDRDAMESEEATSPVNDIAMIRFAGTPPEGTQPIAMMGESDPLTIGETLTLAGFGKTGAHVSDGGLLLKVNTLLTGVSEQAKEIEFGGRPGQSACNGDSGGPAFVKRGGSLKLVGVTSRGSQACDERGIYTDVRQFRAWIDAAIDNL